jgi:hypothetical protein
VKKRVETTRNTEQNERKENIFNTMRERHSQILSTRKKQRVKFINETGEESISLDDIEVGCSQLNLKFREVHVHTQESNHRGSEMEGVFRNQSIAGATSEVKGSKEFNKTS